MDKIIVANALDGLRQLPDQSAHTIATSPPYWGLRDYGVGGQIGLEKTPEEYVEKLVEVFREARRVLRDDGTLWLNLGDSYAASGGHRASGASARVGNTRRGVANLGTTYVPPGLKPKDLIGIPWRVAFALQADGWWLRSDIIWAKSNPMPESVKDRPTKSHEYIFLLAKSSKYYYDQDAIREPAINGERFHGGYDGSGIINKTAARNGRVNPNNRTLYRNKRDVWTVPTKPFKGAHFAVFPPDLIRPCILAGCPPGGIVLDPYIGIELNPEYAQLAKERIARECPMDRLPLDAAP